MCAREIADPATRRNLERISDRIVLILLCGSSVARVVLTLYRQLNADEFQHLHASWMVHLGYLPYRDFWENHAPLLYFLTAPLLAFLGEGVLCILIVRFIHSLVGLIILFAVYRLARLDYDRRTALL